MADTEIKLSAAQKKIVDELNKLSALELSQIVKHLEDEWGVSAAAPAAVAAAPAGDAAPAEEAKSEFNVNLKDVGSQKVAVIKAVKDIPFWLSDRTQVYTFKTNKKSLILARPKTYSMFVTSSAVLLSVAVGLHRGCLW